MTIKKLHQIYITDSNQPLPSSLLEATQTFKNSFPDHSYTLYNSEMLEEFIENNISKEALEAYLKLKPYAYKADFGKYCLMYKLGGWYSDISLKFLKGIQINNCDFLGFVDRGEGHIIPNSIPYPLQASLFYSKENSNIFAEAIDLIIENCKNEYYGRHPVCPTGPGVLGRAFAINGIKPGNVIGEFTALTPYHEYKNRSYLLPNGEIIALHKNAWFPQSRGGELKSFGAQGTNNYIEMYKNKDIYNTQESFNF